MTSDQRALPLEAQAAALAVAAWAVAVALAGRFEIPFVPVPLTLQTLAAMGAGLALGPRRGALAVGLTLLAGAMGLPAFSHGQGGIGHLFNATGGYLWALPLLAAGYGLAARRILIAPVASLGHLLLGTLWLARFDSVGHAFAVGFTPFLLGEAIKAAVALGANRVLRHAPAETGV